MAPSDWGEGETEPGEKILQKIQDGLSQSSRQGGQTASGGNESIIRFYRGTSSGKLIIHL